MPHYVIVNGFVSINGVDLSDQCEAMTVTPSREIKDFTVFGGATATKGRKRLGGLFDWRIRFDFFSNYDVAKVDATLMPLLGVPTAIKARPDGGAISATNPEYQGNGIMGEYSAIGGTVGEPSKTSVEFMMSDGIALIRDIVP